MFLFLSREKELINDFHLHVLGVLDMSLESACTLVQGLMIGSIEF